jgi:hypothetical protein
LKPVSAVRPSLYFIAIECGEARELTLDEEKVVDAFRYFAFLTFLAFSALNFAPRAFVNFEIFAPPAAQSAIL